MRSRTGKFADGLNLYNAYMGVNNSDPYGLFILDLFWLAVDSESYAGNWKKIGKTAQYQATELSYAAAGYPQYDLTESPSTKIRYSAQGVANAGQGLQNFAVDSLNSSIRLMPGMNTALLGPDIYDLVNGTSYFRFTSPQWSKGIFANEYGWHNPSVILSEIGCGLVLSKFLEPGGGKTPKQKPVYGPPVKSTKSGDLFDDVVGQIKEIGKLPNNYITKTQARKVGWNPKAGNLDDVAQGKSIGGDIFRNKEGLLPSKSGRIWYEADIRYSGDFRGSQRLLYSNDGLFYKTVDHYKTFKQIK